MDIRKDFHPVETWMQRLAAFAGAFHENNISSWSHLKNQEDFSNLYELPYAQRAPLEKIYISGRDLAVGMSRKLSSFNSVHDYPTLKSFVDSFDGGWVNQIDLLEIEVSTAESIAASVPNCPWAVKEMITLYRSQMSLLQNVAQCLETLRNSELYLAESGHQASPPKVIAYGTILSSIDGICKVFERNPANYKGRGEEALRDHMLATLEVAVNGSVTGESFNKRGKTDILIRDGRETCFIGECKFWAGSSGFSSTIDQLLSYLSWRDTNTAAIIFVRNKEFTSVIQKADETARLHPQFVRLISQPGETWTNFEFSHPEDSKRIISVAVMLYHLPEN
jgi:hypothetical protein